MGCWSIWKFAKNQENAQKFLIDLLKAGKQATLQSQLYNFPTFAKTFPFEQIRTRRQPPTRTSRRGSTRS